MITLDMNVPQALILPDPAARLVDVVRASGAHWFRAEAQHMQLSDHASDRAVALCSLTSDAVAQKSDANAHGTLYHSAPHAGLLFEAETHTGFQLDASTAGASDWSCILRYQSLDGQARTLFTLSPSEGRNYVFLQHVDGQLILKDRDTSAELDVDAPGRDTPFIVTAAHSDGRLWLRCDEGPITHAPTQAVTSNCPDTLLIGCRSSDARLLKKLGGFVLMDVIFWPGCNVLSESRRPLRDALDAVDWDAAIE